MCTYYNNYSLINAQIKRDVAHKFISAKQRDHGVQALFVCLLLLLIKQIFILSAKRLK